MMKTNLKKVERLLFQRVARERNELQEREMVRKYSTETSNFNSVVEVVKSNSARIAELEKRVESDYNFRFATWGGFMFLWLLTVNNKDRINHIENLKQN